MDAVNVVAASAGALVRTGSTAPVFEGHVRMCPPGWHRHLAFGVGFSFACAAGLLTPFGLLPTVMVGVAAGLGPGAVAYRGRRMLRRARRRLADPAAALVSFERLASRRTVGTGVRCDASAHAALLHLESGDLDAALRWLALPLRDGRASVRARTPRVGYFGEAVRSVVARLFPEAGLDAVTAATLRPSAESTVHVAYEDVPEMVAALRVLEAGDRDSPAAVRGAWAELDAERLAARTPLLCTLVLGVVARFEPTARESLRARFNTLAPAATALALRRFPDLSREKGAAYRVPALVPAPSESLERAAPIALQMLQASPGLQRWLPIAPQGPGMAFLLLWMLMITTAVWNIPVMLLGVTLTAMSVATVLHRRSRVQPLVHAGVSAPERVRELALMGSRTGPTRWGRPTPHPFDRGELMLVVGLARAEHAMREGDIAAAREQIAWWFDGVDATVPTTIDLHATASSALRTATLLGYAAAATVLASAIRLGDSPVGRPRSGHGNAPRALWLARAFCFAYTGDDATAVRALDRAARGRSVTLDAFERELYGALIGRLSARGHIIPSAFQRWAAPAPAWIEALWPSPAGDAPDAEIPLLDEG